MRKSSTVLTRFISVFAAGALVVGMLPAAAFASVSTSDFDGSSDVSSVSADNTASAENSGVGDTSSTDSSASSGQTENSTSGTQIPDAGESENAGSADVDTSSSASTSDSKGVNDDSFRDNVLSNLEVSPDEGELVALIDELDAQSDTEAINVELNDAMSYATIAAKGGKFDKASSVQFPVWNSGNGQNDIRWYTAFNWGGAWVCTVPLTNHRLLGEYTIHAYGVVNGVQEMIGATTFEVKAPKASITSSAGGGDNYVIRIAPTSGAAAIESVSVASWLPAGNPSQVGLIWLNATKAADGSWNVVVPTVGDGRGSGTYANHVYAACSNGASCYLGALNHDFSGSTTEQMSIEVNSAQTAVTIKAFGGRFSRATSVSFPTWSNPSQSDIRWYGASNVNGVWTYTVNISDHKNAGVYNVHAYGVVDGIQQMIKADSFTIDSPKASLALSQPNVGDPLKATLTVTSGKELISYVSFPTWTVANGQDDIVWYMASSSDGGTTWTAEIPTTGPGRGSGTYRCHVYATLNNGALCNISGRDFDVSAIETGSITATINADQTIATVTASGGIFSTASSVQFPTWSLAGGQDDIIWYEADKQNGQWVKQIPISNHRTAGEYAVHAYALSGGAQVYAGACGFTVDTPTGSVVITQSADQIERDEATVTLTLDSISPKVSYVQFPTWTATNGQDDITWYQTNQSVDEGKTWSATISTSGVGRGTGEYIFHVYTVCENGVSSCVAAVRENLEANPTPHITATINADQTIATVTASGGIFSTASSVQFPAWSLAGGQDDVIWYEADKQNGQWVKQIPISNHRTAGEYAVHAYALSGGAQIYAGACGFTVDTPTGTLTISQSADMIERDAASVMLTLDTASPKVSYVQFPTWTATNGQDDIAWYQVNSNSRAASIWTSFISTSGVGRGTDTYIVHAYVMCENGVYAYIDGKSENLEANPDPRLSIELDGTHSTFTIKASGGVFSTASSVQFPTWSLDGGQDDVIWYDAEKQNGQWVKQFPVSNHKTAGKYIAHAYAISNGAQVFGAGVTSTESVRGPEKADVTSKENGNGTISVTISNIQSISGVSGISVPTWTSEGWQDDVVWHSASSSGGSTWTATIAASDHFGREDSYISHVYVTAGNGIQSMLGATQTFLPLKNYSYMTGTYGSGSRTVWIKNPTSSDVQVPVWSDQGGQDDISWIRAYNTGNNLYRADIDCSGFHHAGSATAHVYVGNSMVNAIGFDVAESEIIPAHIRAMYNRIAWMSSNTGWLLAVDTNSCTVGVFTGSAGNWRLYDSFACGPGAPWTPTVKGQYTVTGKGYSFGSGYTCYYYTQFYGNYLFHSVLYYQGTFSIMDGTLGRQVSHGCVRLSLDHAWWIYANIPYGTKVYIY